MEAHAHESHAVGSNVKSDRYLSAFIDGGAHLLGMSLKVFPVNRSQKAAAYLDRHFLQGSELHPVCTLSSLPTLQPPLCSDKCNRRSIMRPSLSLSCLTM